MSMSLFKFIPELIQYSTYKISYGITYKLDILFIHLIANWKWK